MPFFVIVFYKYNKIGVLLLSGASDKNTIQNAARHSHNKTKRHSADTNELL